MAEEEDKPLLTKSTSIDNARQKQEKMQEKIGFRFALTILICNSFGSAIVIMPNIMKNLEPFNWVVITFMIFTTLVFCGILLKEALAYMMDQATGDHKDLIERESWRILALYALNTRFSHLVKWTKYIALIANTIGVFLTAASCLNLVIPLGVDHYNRVRIWLVVCYTLATPFMLYGSYKDMIKHSILGVSASTLSLLSIIVICCLYRFKDGGLSSHHSYIQTTDIDQFRILFTSFGAILYAAAGPGLTAPSIIVNYHHPSFFHYPYTLAYTIVFVIYILCASIPYFTFSGFVQIHENLLDTLDAQFIQNDAGVVFKVLVNFVKIPLSIHLMTSGVFFMNPVFQSMESKLDVSTDFTWKRVAVRIPMLILLLVISLLLPFFAPIISLVGAVPLTLLLVIFPMMTFYFLFDNVPLFSKIIMVTLTVTCTVFMVGNMYYNIRNLILKSK